MKIKSKGIIVILGVIVLITIGIIIQNGKSIEVSIEGVPQRVIGDSDIKAVAKAAEAADLDYFWVLNGKEVSNDSVYDLKELPDGFYRLEITAISKNGKNSGSAEMEFTVTGRSNKELFFDKKASWKFLDSGTSPEAAWISKDFDDSAWNEGSGLFGFNGEATDKTIDTPMKSLLLNTNEATSYYFRKNVSVERAESLDSVYLNLTADFGSVVYVNGKEAFRTALVPEGDTPFDFELKNYSKEAYGKAVSYKLDGSLFVDGDNIIAIQVITYLRKIETYGAAFMAELTRDYPYDYLSDGPYVFYRDNEILVKSIGSDGYNEKILTDKDKTVTVILPDDLGSFDVTLKGEFEPEESSYEKPSKFFVTSDIEGNIQAFVLMLREAGIIDVDYNWIYGDGHLVYLGDMFDRGDYVTESLWLLYHLEAQAEKAGGNVHFILGNHDIMQFYSDFRYVNAKYFQNFPLLGETLFSYLGKDSELGRWLRSKNLLTRLGDILFVHAGIRKDLAELYSKGELTDQIINNTGREHMEEHYMSKGNTDPFYYPSRLYWDRNIAQEKYTPEEVDTIMTSFNCNKLILGHTVYEEPTYIYNDKVIMADVPHGENYFDNGFVQGLIFESGNYYRFVTTKEGTVTKTELISSVN